MVIGCCAVDVTSRAHADVNSTLASQSTVPGTVTMTLGGVGRNIAEAAHRILAAYPQQDRSDTVLVSPIGDDPFGRVLVEETALLQMRTDGLLHIKSQRSAFCNMVLDREGDLVSGVADMDIIHSLTGYALYSLTDRQYLLKMTSALEIRLWRQLINISPLSSRLTQTCQQILYDLW